MFTHSSNRHATTSSYGNLTEEPLQIGVQLYERGELYEFEQVLRIRKWIPNEKLYSWSIYSEGRDFSRSDDSAGGIVMRLARWDKRYDIESLKTGDEKRREQLLNAVGSLQTENIYLGADQCNTIVQQFSSLDALMNNGCLLTQRSPTDAKPDRSDFEIARRFNWGQVHITWSSQKINREIEEQVDRLEKLFMGHKTTHKIHRLVLDYSVLPSMYQSNITGINALR